MSSQTSASFAGPSGLSEYQWATLLAISDALVGPLSADAGADGASSDPTDPTHQEASSDLSESGSSALPQCRPSETREFLKLLRDTFETRVPPRATKELGIFLSIVGSTVGSVIFNGTSTPLSQLGSRDVEGIIKGWYGSRLRPIRMGIKATSIIVRAIWLRTCPGLSTAMGYPGPPLPNAPGAEAGHEPAPPSRAGDDILAKGKAVVYDGETAIEIRTGVLVIGSGSGGTAFTHSLVQRLTGGKGDGEEDWKSNLYGFVELENGMPDILVVEKGKKYVPHPGGIPLAKTEGQGLEDVMESGGIMTTEESSISLIAGSTWGGGSRINWSACLRTDRMVREEWTKHMGRDRKERKAWEDGMFMSDEWQDCTEAVESQLKIQTPRPEDHNRANRVLLDGARRLGYSCRAVPQNISGTLESHKSCGANCMLGCRAHDHVDTDAGKMSGCRAFLGPLYGQEGIVVKGLDGFQVERVIIDKKTNRVEGAWGWIDCTPTSEGGSDSSTRQRVLIKASLVVVSAGSFHSPALLLQSGIKNPHLGRNLHLHPTVIVHSQWKEEVRPWEGTILTTAITEYDNLDGLGHGVKIEAMNMLPSFGMAWAPWEGNSEWKERVAKYRYTMGHIVLCRDRDTGTITVDPATGRLQVSYVPSAFDRAHTMQGVLALSKLLHTMGALEISMNTVGAPTWKRDPSAGKVDWSSDESFLSFLENMVKVGNDLDRTGYGSAHQMGTCRMATSPSHGVVDPIGQVYGVKGLYVADASVFPSASGVNPMLTTMTFGEWIGRRVATRILSNDF